MLPYQEILQREIVLTYENCVLDFFFKLSVVFIFIYLNF